MPTAKWMWEVDDLRWRLKIFTDEEFGISTSSMILLDDLV